MKILKSQKPNSNYKLSQKILDLEMEILRLEKVKLDTLSREYILVHHQNKKQLIGLTDIVMIEAQSNYTTIYLQSGNKILTAKTLKHWQSKITNNSFIRTHKSFLVNCNYIQSINKQTHYINLINGIDSKYSRALKSPDLILDNVKSQFN